MILQRKDGKASRFVQLNLGGYAIQWTGENTEEVVKFLGSAFSDVRPISERFAQEAIMVVTMMGTTAIHQSEIVLRHDSSPNRVRVLTEADFLRKYELNLNQ